MNENTCGCCEGIEIITPQTTANRPGLGALTYRVGTHATFLETMKARLSGLYLEVPVAEGSRATHRVYPLQALTTQQAGDPAIALLDAWATVADVLTFYQERIANEGYLLTAGERRSILELARLVGYRLRPGVAASVFLAFELDKGYQVEIPAGVRAQSIPGPGELPQAFETAEPLHARAEWNALRPRLLRPQYITYENAERTIEAVYFDGISTNLRENSPLLFFFRSNPQLCHRFRQVAAVEVDALSNRTRVVLLPPDGETSVEAGGMEQAAKVIGSLPALNGATADKISSILQPIRDILDGHGSLSALQETIQKAVLRLEGVDTVLLGETGAPLRLWNSGLIKALTGLLDEQPTRPFSVRFGSPAGFEPGGAEMPAVVGFGDIVDRLAVPQPIQPANSDQLLRPLTTIWSAQSASATRLLSSLDRRLDEETLYEALGAAPLGGPKSLISVDTLRVRAAPFGHNAPLKPIYGDDGRIVDSEEWPINGVLGIGITLLRGQSEPLASPPPDTLVTKPESSILLRNWRVGISLQRPTGTASTVAPVSIGSQALEQEISVGEDVVGLAMGPLIRFVDGRFENGPETTSLTVYVDGKLADLQFSNSDALPKITPYSSLAPGRHTFQFEIAERSQKRPEATFPLELGRAYSIVAAITEDSIVPVLLPGGIVPPAANHVQFRVAHLDADSGAGAVTVQVRVVGSSDEPATICEALGPLSGSLYVPVPTNDSTKEFEVEVLDLQGNRLYSEALTHQPKASWDIYLQDLHSDPRIVHVAYSWSSSFQDVGLTFDFMKPARRFWLHMDRYETDITMQLLTGEKLVKEWKTAFGQTIRERFNGRKIFVDLNTQRPHLAYEEVLPLPPEERRILALDQTYDQIILRSLVVIQRPGKLNPQERETHVLRVEDVTTVSSARYGLSGQSTRLILSEDWLDDEDLYLSVYRGTRVYAQNEQLALADEPITDTVCGASAADTVRGVKEIELDGLYRGLESGRWVIISGERTDVPGVTGLHASELAMIAAVREGVEQIETAGDDAEDRPGDTLHTTISFAEPLAYCYKRDTVNIYGNVVKATHGETRTEVLGSGDGTQARQRFALKQKPLTHVAAATPTGADTTLEVRVDDVRWHEADNLFVMGPNDRQYITRTDDEQTTAVLFGDGLNGARLPTGVENVKVIYRSGIGRPGNVAAEQISLLATRPLGVKGVINPMAAIGGADRETRDQARGNVPLALLALDRLVSVQDYADFARTFAGIGKAYAARLSNGRQQVVHLTIAGADDIPIDKSSDLYRNLRHALRKYGDPYQPVEIDLRELVLLLVKARVRVLADHNWETVAPKVRAALLDAFSFQKRELGQDVLASEVISVIQQVPGVDYVDLDLLGAVSESDAEDPDLLADKLKKLVEAPRCAPSTTDGQNKDCQPQARIEARLPSFEPNTRTLQRAQLAILSPQVPETLILEVIP